MNTTDKVQTTDSTTSTGTSTTSTYYTYTGSSPSYNAEKGWECPRCGRINAPWVRQCDCPNNWNCPTITWTYPGKDSHEDWWKTYVTCGQADANTYTTTHNPVVGGSDYWDSNSNSYKNTTTYATNTIHDKKLKSKEK